MAQKEWYVIQTLSSHEDKVKRIIEKEKRRWQEADQIGQIKIPTYKERSKGNDGKNKEVSKKSMPGYVFIELDYTEVLYSKLRQIPGIMGFVIDAGKVNPEPLSKEEVESIFTEVEGVQENKSLPQIPYSVGNQVEILEGSFTTFKGIVDEINHEKGKLKVSIEIFGRSTTIEVDYTQVSRV